MRIEEVCSCGGSQIVEAGDEYIRQAVFTVNTWRKHHRCTVEAVPRVTEESEEQLPDVDAG